MPPKQKFTPEDVVEAAFQIVRRQGWKGLSARAIAAELGSSTRPIYDYFQSMKEIEVAVVKKALAVFVAYISRERTGDRWLDQAIGYTRFAAEEKHLFRCINDEEHIRYQREFARQHWSALGDQLSGDERFKGLPEDTMHRIRVARWFMVHGIAFLIANGWMGFPVEGQTPLEGDFVGMNLNEFLDRANSALYHGFKT
jgi:AcrR family transcriptional regulator